MQISVTKLLDMTGMFVCGEYRLWKNKQGLGKKINKQTAENLVCLHVFLHVGLLGKGSATDDALKRFLSCVTAGRK